MKARVCAAVLTGAAVLAGCQTGVRGTAVETTKKGEKAVLPAKDYTDRLVQSAMRERAIEVIESASRDASAEVRSNAVEASQKMPARADALLAMGLKDESPAVRTVAAMAVGRLKARALTAPTRPLLHDSSIFAQAAAIYALTRCGEQVDPSPLASMLLSDPSTRARAHAATVLGLIGNPTAMPLLKQAAHEGVPRATQVEERLLQLQIAEAMVRLGDTQAVNAIYSALYPGRAEELEASALAAQILGELRDKPSIDRLIYLVEYRNPQGQKYSAEVRLAAAMALARLGIVRGGFVADEFWTAENPALRSQAAFTYGEIGTPESLAHLDVMLGDIDPRVRVSAANGVLNIIDTLGGPRTRNSATR